MNERVEQLDRLIRDRIPAARQMEIRVLGADEKGVELGAPLSENHNDKGTAFAGCLYSIAVLTGWTLVNKILFDNGWQGDVMIVESTMVFLKPVTADFHARCPLPDDDRVEAFARAFREKGKGWLALSVTVSAGSVEAVRFEGKYYARTIYPAEKL